MFILCDPQETQPALCADSAQISESSSEGSATSMSSVCRLDSTIISLDPYLPPSTFRYDLTDQDYTLVKEGPPLSVEPTKLLFSRFVAENEVWISGEELIRRIEETLPEQGPMAGQWQEEALLSQSDKIPIERREGALVFLATNWRHPHGGTCVTYLCWFACQWEFRFDYLGAHRWGKYDRVVRLPYVPPTT